MFISTPAAGQNPRFPPHGIRTTVPPPDSTLISIFAPAEVQATTLRAARGDKVVGQGDPAKYCYLVLSGCVRTVRLMEDGRRQIGEFLLAGDLFGWEALGEHNFGAEVVTPATFLRYPRQQLEALAWRDPALAARLYALAAGQLRADRERMVLLGRKTAVERVATFLLEMAARLGADAGDWVDLPMSRTDIADYLGLTIETVCRGITYLGRQGIITVKRSGIAIRDRRALALAGSQSLH